MKIEALFGQPLRTVGLDIHLYMLSAQVDSRLPGFGWFCEPGRGMSDARELENLKQDLLRLELGWRPSYLELASTPELQKWGILDIGAPLPKIVGDIGQSSADGRAFADGKRFITGHVLARDSELTWVRDRSGFYRLDALPEPNYLSAPGRRRRSIASFQSSRNGRLRA